VVGCKFIERIEERERERTAEGTHAQYVDQPCSISKNRKIRLLFSITTKTEFCKNSFAQRHNSLAAELRQICNMAGVECMTEVQCIPGSTDVPADIYIHNGPGGVPLAVDTSVATPLSASILRSFHVMSKPGACIRNRESHKIGRYKEHFDSVNGSIQYLPFVMSTFGGSGLLARRLLLLLSQKLSERWGVPFESARTLVQNRISSGLMKYAAISLSRALSNHESQLLSA